MQVDAAENRADFSRRPFSSLNYTRGFSPEFRARSEKFFKFQNVDFGVWFSPAPRRERERFTPGHSEAKPKSLVDANLT